MIRWFIVWTVLLAAIAAPGVTARGEAQQTAPSNDNFDRSQPVSLGNSPPFGGYEVFQSTAGATLEEGEPACVPDGGASVWFILFPDSGADLVVDTAGSSFSTFVSVYRITDQVPSPPGGSLEELTCSGGAGSQASVEFTASTGRGDYAIQIGGVGGETGTLHLRVSCKEGTCPPANDNIATASRLFELPFVDNSLNTLSASTEPGEPLPCGDIGRTVWYRFDTFDDGGDAVSIFATSAELDPVMAVYKIDYSINPSPLGALTQIACVFKPEEDFPGYTLTTEPFTSYYVQIGGAAGAGGPLSVLLSCTPGAGLSPCFFGSVSIDTGEGEPVAPPVDGRGGGGESPGGSVRGPDTGSGGYLPGAR